MEIVRIWLERMCLSIAAKGYLKDGTELQKYFYQYWESLINDVTDLGEGVKDIFDFNIRKNLT